MSMRTAALAYADRGWQVFPLHTIRNGRCSCGTACSSPGKHPLTIHGFQDATDDPDVVNQWWTDFPDANIGIRTGSKSNLWVVDQDAKRSIQIGDGLYIPEGENSIRTVEQQLGEQLPETLTVITGGGGRHYYYDYPNDGVRHGNRGNIIPSVDIRGEDGYVVAPPSIHENGQPYRWIDEGDGISKAPEWFLKLDSVSQSEPFEIKQHVVEGGRNTYLISYAGKLRSEGSDGDTLRAQLLGHNLLVCKPPLDSVEVLRIAENALKYEPGAPALILNFEGVDGQGNPITPPTQDMDPNSVAISFHDFMSSPPEPKTPIVWEGWLDQEDGFILGGQSGVGKSWLAFDLALSVASGAPWLGEFATTAGPVVYIDEEGSRSGMYDRMQKVMAGKDIQDTRIPIHLVIRKSLKFDSPEGLSTISRIIHEHRPVMVICDTLVRMHTGEENSAKDMARFFDLSSKLRSWYGCAIGFIHHTTKPSKDFTGDYADMLRGSGDIRGWPDSIMMAVKSDDGLTLHHAKSREHQQHAPVSVALDINDTMARIRSQGQAKISHGGVEETRDLIFDRLKLMQAQGAVSAEMLAGQMNMSVRAIKEHLKVLVAQGAIEEWRNGQYSTATYSVPSPTLTQGTLA
jgi:guanyl-specific ribonuclease Sa